ncbi:ParM/StbA family protein [Gottfriedia sp. NPDC057948]|uniref:ParM/StbA family protein n=1 Tax=Gottfriedia sp. NPDC057948 TaxID=3346287 RepID=UPI0036D843CB
MLLGIDAGNNEVKVATQYGVFAFNSCLGDYHERRIETKFQDEMIVEYNGVTYFAGELAEKESYYPRRSMGASKANEDVKIRILIAVFRFSNEYSNTVIVGQPIERHLPAEKAKIKEMLIGEHTVKLNGQSKTFKIDQVIIALEGASCFFGWFTDTSTFRIIDCGSGTVNIATIREWDQVDKESFTLNFGANSTRTNNLNAMAQSIVSETSKYFQPNDFILLVGGAAKAVYPVVQSAYPLTRLAIPLFLRKRVEPKFANCIGFYNLGKELLNNG